MADKMQIDISVKDGGSAEKLKKVQSGVEGVDKSGKAATKTSKSMGSALTGLKAGALAAAAGAAVLAAGVAKLTSFLAESVEAFREQDAVNNRLKNSLAQVGLEGDKLSETYQMMQGVIGALAQSTSFGDEAIGGMLATLQGATTVALSAAEAQRALSTSLGIAAQEGKAAEEASRIYAKALKGEIEPLKDLLPLTKEQIKTLTDIKDPSERAARATGLLAERYGGLAETAQGGLFASLKNVTDALGDTKQAIGGVIVESGAFTPILDVMNGLLIDLQGYIGSNSEAWGQWIRDGVSTAVTALGKALSIIDKLSPVLATVFAVVKSMASAWRAWGNVVQIVWKSIAGFVTVTLQGLTIGLDKLLAGFEGIATFLDSPFAASIKSAREGIQSVEQTLNQTNLELIDSIKGDASEIVDSVTSIKENFESIPASSKAISNLAQRLGVSAEKVASAVNSIKSNVQRSPKGREQTSVAGTAPGAAANDDVEDPFALEAASKAKEIQLEILGAREKSQERLAAQLEFQKAITSITAQGLTGLDATVARKEAVLAFDQRIAALDQAEEERKKEAEERRIEALQRQQDLQRQLLEKERQRVSQMTDGIARAFAGVDAAPALDGLVHLGTGLDDIIFKFQRMREAGAAQGEALSGAMGAAQGVIGGALKAIGLDTRQLAGIQAGMEIARGIAALAVGNIPGAVAHGAAAAAFGAVAAGAGSSGASSSGASAGASSPVARTSGPSRTPASRRRQTAGAFSSGAVGSGSGGSVTHIYHIQEGATVLSDDVQTQKRIREGIEAGNRRTSLGGSR